MKKRMIIALCICLAISVTACSQRGDTKEPATLQSQSASENSSMPSEQEVDNESTDLSDNGEPLEQSSVQDEDDIRNKTFISSWLNLALSDDGYLYSFHDDAGIGEIEWVEIAHNVKKLDRQYTNGFAPRFQTYDNRYFGILSNGELVELVEYKHNIEDSYTLCGNYTVVNEKNELYRVNWSQDRAVTEADLDYIMLGVDAADIIIYIDGKIEYNAVTLSDAGVLYIFDSLGGSLKEIDFDVSKFYAGVISKISGGCGVWYLTKDNMFHSIAKYDPGLYWDLDNIYHVRHPGVIDFWRISDSYVLILCTDNSLKIINNSGDIISYAQVPESGVSNVVTVFIKPPDDLEPVGPYLPRPECLMIDENGKLLIDEWVAHPYSDRTVG